MQKLLAYLCKFCPFCVIARAFPKSAFAKKLKEVEKDCPACQAYQVVFKDEIEKNKRKYY